MKMVGSDTGIRYKTIDNFLEKEDFNNIKDSFMTHDCAWYYSTKVGTMNEIDDLNNSYFVHRLYQDHESKSNKLKTMVPVFNKLGMKVLIRAKANLFTRTEKIHYFDIHQDLNFDANAAILYLNNCDGFTILEHSTRDPEKRVTISSIENRLLLFKADTPHRSTSCTDQKFRMNININYI
tara:strand:- start:3848 stop:4387 length:540 start_codon:yes stop_codon:yes gene_type:complete